MDINFLNFRFSLVVTEIADAGLLGEEIIPTLQHAWSHLLQENKSREVRKVIKNISTHEVASCLLTPAHIVKELYLVQVCINLLNSKAAGGLYCLLYDTNGHRMFCL